MNETGLRRLIENAGLTADALKVENKSKNRIKNAQGEAEKIEDLTKDLYILQIIREELAKIPEPKNTSRNIFFKREQTSLEFSRGMSQKMSQKQEELTKNIEKELNKARVMEDNLFEKVRHPSPYGVPLTINKRILNELDKNKSIQKYSKNEETTVKTLLMGHSQIILTSNPNNQVRQSLTAYKKVIEAKYKNEKYGLTKPEFSSTSPNIDAEYTVFLNNDITKIDERIKKLSAYHPLADTTRLKNMRNEIATVSKQFYELKKNRIIIDRLINLANQMSNGQKEQLIIKLEKEKKEIDKNINLLQDRLAVVKQNFEVEFKKVEEYAINLENSKKEETKPIEGIRINESGEIIRDGKGTTLINDDIPKFEPPKKQQPEQQTTPKKQPLSKGKIPDAQKKQLENLKKARKKLIDNKEKLENKEEKNISPEEQQERLYKKYVELRNKFDALNEKAKNEFDLRTSIITYTCFHENIGRNYEEIVENLTEMRRQLESTKQIERIITEIKLEYENSEDWKKEEANGLTILENRIAGRFQTILTNGNISPQLKSELEYYYQQYMKVEKEVKPIYEDKHSYGAEEYQEKLANKKKKYYFNTEILDEVNLSYKAGRTK